jgi:hypothetical protein
MPSVTLLVFRTDKWDKTSSLLVSTPTMKNGRGQRDSWCRALAQSELKSCVLLTAKRKRVLGRRDDPFGIRIFDFWAGWWPTSYDRDTWVSAGRRAERLATPDGPMIADGGEARACQDRLVTLFD